MGAQVALAKGTKGLRQNKAERAQGVIERGQGMLSFFHSKQKVISRKMHPYQIGFHFKMWEDLMASWFLFWSLILVLVLGSDSLSESLILVRPTLVALTDMLILKVKSQRLRGLSKRDDDDNGRCWKILQRSLECGRALSPSRPCNFPPTRDIAGIRNRKMNTQHKF